MNATLSEFRYRALIGVSILVFVLPVFLYMALGGFISWISNEENIPTVSGALILYAWYWIFGPFVAGYLVAKAALIQPLLHGLLVGVVGVLFESIFLRPIWWLWLGMVVMVITLSIFGAWIWRYRASRTI